MSDHEQEAALVRSALKGHSDDGGAIGAFVGTGEITEELFPALDSAAARLEDQGDHEEARKVAAVITYAMEARGRGPVPGWAT
ncbi:hypothetical protein ACIQ9Q_17115 [Streptomyces sp. NPDC094438]|uniref:hypothetical protein n=1 Tax=Streptomyces sp. NPDC094438 TaxID=3366061 RepID=UPI003800095E